VLPRLVGPVLLVHFAEVYEQLEGIREGGEEQLAVAGILALVAEQTAEVLVADLPPGLDAVFEMRRRRRAAVNGK
jgi:hypothetical protein